jgi:[acyl-carrier-protein] S-malonyltransferase
MNKHAYIFPGQGAQFSGMGKNLFDTNENARELFEQANDILGFRISDIMFTGTDEELKQTKVTQPAIFLHSVIAFKNLNDAKPDMVAGHSLGEFSALVANNVLSFEDALKLVSIRATAMQKACEINPSTMAAVLGLADEKVEELCKAVTSELGNGQIVVAANYNCPGQLVISGSTEAIDVACQRMKEAGAKRAIVLAVGGAFHSPLMEPAKEELEAAIASTKFNEASCPVYQNVVAKAVTDTSEIKTNLIAQLTAPVRWTQSVQAMVADGATHFTEVGPGKVLQGLVNKIYKEAITDGVS